MSICKPKQIPNLIFHSERPNSNYTIVPNATLQDPNLSWGATGFLAYLRSLPRETWNANFAHLSTCRPSKRTATQSVRKELIECGYLKLEQIRDSLGRVTHVIWHFFDQPKSHNSENQIEGNRDAGSPDVENQPLLIKHSKKEIIKETTDTQPDEFSLEIEPPIQQHLKLIQQVVRGISIDLAQAVVDTFAARIANSGRQGSNEPISNPKLYLEELVRRAKRNELDTCAADDIAASRVSRRTASTKRLAEEENHREMSESARSSMQAELGKMRTVLKKPRSEKMICR